MDKSECFFRYCCVLRCVTIYSVFLLDSTAVVYEEVQALETGNV